MNNSFYVSLKIEYTYTYTLQIFFNITLDKLVFSGENKVSTGSISYHIQPTSFNRKTLNLSGPVSRESKIRVAKP